MQEKKTGIGKKYGPEKEIFKVKVTNPFSPPFFRAILDLSKSGKEGSYEICRISL